MPDGEFIWLNRRISGLDSKNAEDLIKILSLLAHGGRTILCSIHQPSIQVRSVITSSMVFWIFLLDPFFFFLFVDSTRY